MKRLFAAAAALTAFLAFAPPALAQADPISALLETANAQLNGDGVPQDLDAAISGFSAALGELEAVKERRIGDEIFAQNQLGFALHLSGRYAEAAGHFGRTLDLMAEAGKPDRQQLAQVRFNRAIAWRLSGRQDEAIPEFIAILPDFEALPAQEVFAKRGFLSYHLGNALIEAGRAADGRDILQLSFDDLVNIDPPDIPTLAEIVMTIGGTYLDTAAFREAMAEFDKAAEILNLMQPADQMMLARALTLSGVARRALGDYAGALAQHGKALDAAIVGGGPDHPFVAEIHSNRGVVFTSLDRKAEAREAFATALAIYGKAYGPQSVEVADVVFNIAGVDFDDGSLAKALAGFEQAMAIYETLDPPDPQRIATTLSNLGSIYVSLYSFDKAMAAFDRALTLLPADNRYAIDLRSNRAMALVRLGRNEEALAAYTEVIADYTRAVGAQSAEVARSHVNLGSVYSGLGRHADAAREHRLGYDIFLALLGPRHAMTIAAAGNVGYSELMNGRETEAFAALAHVLAAGGQGDSSRFAYEILGIFAVALELPTSTLLFGKLAVNAQRQELDVNSGLSQDLLSGLANRFGGIHTALAEGLIADGLFSEAQYVNSLLKKEEFAAYTRSAPAAPEAINRVALTPSEQRLEERLAAIIVKAGAAIGKAEAAWSGTPEQRAAALAAMGQAMNRSGAEISAMVAGIEAQRATIQAERLAQNAKRMAEARQTLAAYGGEAMLYTAISLDNELHLILLQPGRSEPQHAVVKIARKDLASKVYAALAAIESRDPDAVAKLQELHSLLVAPLGEAFTSAGASVVMLDVGGFLRYVPFAALHDGKQFMAERYATVNYNAAGTAQPGIATGQGSAGFGTTQAHGDFAALPGVAKELEAIFKGGDGQGYLDGEPLLDGAFTLDALRGKLSARPRYVHIGSHFRFTPGNDQGSSLLLGTGEEIRMDAFRTDPGLKFSGVDLLVLSACETARGSGAEGAEIESLGALAQNNGARAVMATLWPIADEASARLMADFYRGLVADGLDKARALQRAQIAMIRDVDAGQIVVGQRGASSAEEGDDGEGVPALAHPYFWSPFVLMGQWN